MIYQDSPGTSAHAVDPDAVEMASQAASISFVCEPGRLEAKAVLLAASLRQAHPELTLVAGITQPLPAGTAHALDVLGVIQAAITNPVASDYRIGNKVAALAAGEATGLRVFLDSDMLCLRALDWPVLRSHRLAAKPADMVTFGSDETWQRLYARAGLALPSARVVATIGQQMMYPYFNAGMLATTEAGTLAPLWAELCREIDAMDDINPRRPWLDQIALPLAVARLGLEIRSLGEDWNYPAHVKPLLGQPYLVHYHQPAVVMREPALSACVAGLLSRYPAITAVVQADPAWQSVGDAIARRPMPVVSLQRRWTLRRQVDAPARPQVAVQRDLIVTGIPCSGTSYVCRSLDQFGNVAVFNEPSLLFAGLRYGPEPWTVPVLHADLRARIDAGEAVENKLDACGELTEDTAVEEAIGGYRPRLENDQWVLATKNTLAYLARLEGILRVMPQARVVACVRHPLDTLASWKGTFAHLVAGDPSQLPVGGLEDPFLPAHLRAGMRDLVQLCDPAMRRAAWWRLLAMEILRWRERIEVVRYEDMVADPAAQMQRLLGPLAAAAGTPGKALMPSAPRVTRRRLLDEADWRAAGALCADVAEAFGYDCSRRPTELS